MREHNKKILLVSGGVALALLIVFLMKHGKVAGAVTVVPTGSDWQAPTVEATPLTMPNGATYNIGDLGSYVPTPSNGGGAYVSPARAKDDCGCGCNFCGDTVGNGGLLPASSGYLSSVLSGEITGQQYSMDVINAMLSTDYSPQTSALSKMLH